MTEIGAVYGQSLYELAKAEAITDTIAEQISAMQTAFRQEPEYIRLLCSPSLTKAERCRILDDGFRGRIHPYLLNFLKILTEKGYARHFGDCCQAFTGLYHQDNGILSVTAVTAVALTGQQDQKLREKLSAITGKKIELHNSIDPQCLGGVRLDYDGQRLDGTVSHRLDAVRELLKNTAL